jgi:RNA polymerase sigma-70 factor (ECF subfamily)
VPAVDEQIEEHELLSFEWFYRSEYAAMVRLAFVLTGRRDVAEELVQDAFAVCFQRWGTVSGYANAGTWMRRVVTNRCVSSGRRHLTELRLVARLRSERPPIPAMSDRSDRLWSVLRGLPKRQAQVLALVFVDDLSVDAVAGTLGIGSETVRTHLRRGRAALAAGLSEVSDDE